MGGKFEGHELTEDALPSLNCLIKELVVDIEAAADQLWEQYREALSPAQGQERQS